MILISMIKNVWSRGYFRRIQLIIYFYTKMWQKNGIIGQPGMPELIIP